MNRIIFILTLCLSFAATSQDIERQKAGWLYLLTNSLSWPGNPDEYVISVITEDRQLATAFNTMATKRQINDKPIKISFSSYVSIPDGLHIIYVTEGYNDALQNIIDDISGKPILIITEKSSDQQYVMINMVDTPDGISFQYNKANILNQGIRIKPEFEDLGGDEINVEALYQATRNTVRSMEQKSRSIDESIDTLNMLTAVAVKVGSNLLAQMSETQAEIDRQSQSLDSIIRHLANREVQLLDISKQISIKSDSIRNGEELLAVQGSRIKYREEAIAQKETELKGLVLIINSQLEILIFLVVFALLFLLALFLFYKGYKARRRDAKQLNEQKEELDELLEKVQGTQKKLIHAEKLATVGELSESIAHEVNNASNYILSGIHIIHKRFAESKSLMEDINSLDEGDSNLKTKMKVRDLVDQKAEIDFDSYEPVIKSAMNSIQVGADRILNVLKDLKPYFKYEEMGRLGLALLGKEVEDRKQSPSTPKMLPGARKTKKIPERHPKS